jgi:hypothetical protein
VVGNGIGRIAGVLVGGAGVGLVAAVVAFGGLGG